jgi:hypothetical protein
MQDEQANKATPARTKSKRDFLKQDVFRGLLIGHHFFKTG